MRDIALTLFVLGLIPFIMMSPYIGLLVWSWFGYMNPHRLTFGFAYSFPWVQLIAILTLISLVASKENKRIQWSSTGVLMLIFLLWTGVTTAFAVMRPEAWEKWQQFAKIMVMVFVTMIVVDSRERMHWLVWVIVISLGFYGVKGGIFTLTHGGENHVLGPPGSFIAGNNALAQALCMILPLIRYLQLQAKRKYQWLLLGVALFLTGIGILGTYSRGGMIALAIVGVALILKSRRRMTTLLIIVALGYTAYHFMPPKWIARMDTISHARTVNTAQTRIQSWEFAANYTAHHPILGGGFFVNENVAAWNTYAPEGAQQRAIHSIYFRVLGEQGFVGFGLFLAMLIMAWRSCSSVRRATRHSLEDRWAFDLASMLQVSVLAFMTAGLATTASYFDLSFQLLAMCALLKVIAVTRRAETPSGEELAEPSRAMRGEGALVTSDRA